MLESLNLYVIMPPLQICLAAQTFYPFYAGGALRFMHYLPGLKEREIHTRVFTGTPEIQTTKSLPNSWQKYPPGQILPVEMVNGTPVYRLWLPDAGPKQRVWQYSWSLVQFCGRSNYQPDLVQLLPLPFWSIPALLNLRRTGLPLVYAYNLLKEPPGHAARRWFYRWLRRLQLHLVDCVVVNSGFMRDHLVEAGIKTRIRVIANGVDIQRFSPAATPQTRQAIRHSLGIAPDVPLVITIGSVEPRKGTDLLLAAWVSVARACPQGHLVIVGPRTDQTEPGLEPYRRKLEGLVVDSGAPERIHFVGRVENVEDYLQAADLFVFTSVREGLPNVVLEAMAAGLPVLTTRFAGLSGELGQAGEHYLMAEREPERLGECIEELLANQELRAGLGTAARSWAEAEMDVEKIMDQYAALYREIANKKVIRSA